MTSRHMETKTIEDWDAYVTAHAEDSVNFGVVGRIVTRLLRTLKAMGDKNRERDTRIEAFEKRIAELEQRPGLKYCGVWRDDATYHLSDVVTKGGSMWAAKLNHLQSEPGNDNGVGWVLAVKHG